MFTLDDVLTVRALKNIENRYNRQHDVGYGAKLEREATSGQTGKMEELYTGVPGFVEIQVF